MGQAPGRGLHRASGAARRNQAGLTRIPGPTTIHLIRHATHALLPHTLAGRSPGIPLSAEGAAEASRLAAAFKDPLAAILSSPVLRAQQTAAALAAARGLPVEADAGFEEIDFGAWTGATFDRLAQDPAWQAWNRLRGYAGTPGGETMQQAQSRALAALSRARARFPGQPLAIVTHADIIKALLAPALDLSLDRLYRLAIDPASVSTLTLFDDDVRVDRVNMRYG